MPVRNLPVDTYVAIYILTDVFVQEIALVTDYAFTICLLEQITDLTGCIAAIVETSENIHTSCTVIEIQGSCSIITFRPLERLGIAGVQCESEAVSLAPDGADTDDAIDGSIILSTRIGDDLNTLDLIALQSVQLTAVGHFATVYINKRCALSDDLDTVLILDYTRRLGKYVRCSTGIFQDRATDVGLQSFSGEFGLRHYGRDHCTLKQRRIFRQGDHHIIFRHKIPSLISQHRHHQDSVHLVCDHIECAVFS